MITRETRDRTQVLDDRRGGTAHIAGGDVATRFDYVDREANRSLIELKTRSQSSLDGLRRDIRKHFRELFDALELDGKRLAPLDTPLSRVESNV